MNSDLDVGTVTGEMLVHGIVEHLEDTVMKTALVGVADIHPRALAHCLQTL